MVARASRCLASLVGSSCLKYALVLMQDFHPLVRDWFNARFGVATEPQRRSWPQIRAGHDVLIGAPIGSGKTRAAFLVCLDRLVARAAETGDFDDRTEVAMCRRSKL